MVRPFVRMNGCGNAFVVIADEARGGGLAAEQARAIAHPREGPGCDQVLLLSPSAVADLAMRVWNADGGEVGACGNGARCAAWLALEASGRREIALETADRVLRAWRDGERRVAIDMGRPALDWREVPLAAARDTASFAFTPAGRKEGRFGPAAAVSIGNPHVVFFVADAAAVNLSRVGPGIETDPLFPERANVGFAEVVDPATLRLRVWERGAGATRACGTGACAAVVAAARRGLAGRRVRVLMEGGELQVTWRDDDHVILAGAVEVEGGGRLAAMDWAA